MMLDFDTVLEITDLTANNLYMIEVNHLPKLSRESENELIDLARQGDQKAREALIMSCLKHARGVAHFIYHARRPQHDDLLDLVQVASECMAENLDKALATKAPAAYLRGIGRQAIMRYCTYHSSLIDKPEYTLSVLEKIDPHPTTIESLDAPLYQDGKQIIVDLIEAPTPQPEPDEETMQRKYAALYEAIRTLPEFGQEAIIRLYGLFGNPAETAGDIGPRQIIHDRASYTRKKLRKLLAEHLQQMLDYKEE
jgi:DNA-directed RNA polymerase specialized sigma24 family protein